MVLPARRTLTRVSDSSGSGPGRSSRASSAGWNAMTPPLLAASKVPLAAITAEPLVNSALLRPCAAPNWVNVWVSGLKRRRPGLLNSHSCPCRSTSMVRRSAIRPIRLMSTLSSRVARPSARR